MGLKTIFYCPNFWESRGNRVAQLYLRALGSFSVASYDSQDYGGSILQFTVQWQWSESRRNRNHTLLSYLWLPQPGGPGSRIYIPQEQGGPVIPPGTVFPSRHILRLSGPPPLLFLISCSYIVVSLTWCLESALYCRLFSGDVLVSCVCTSEFLFLKSFISMLSGTNTHSFLLHADVDWQNLKIRPLYVLIARLWKLFKQDQRSVLC
jgi:hypothetical protein